MNELIVLPKAAHARIPEAIRAAGIEVESHDDRSIARHRRPGDSLYLCRRGEAAVELLVTAADEIPTQIGDFTGVIFFPHGRFMRRFKSRSMDAQLQQTIGSILHQLKTELSHEGA
jgi:hypothetical protein